MPERQKQEKIVIVLCCLSLTCSNVEQYDRMNEGVFFLLE